MAETSAMVLEPGLLNVIFDKVQRAQNSPGGAKPTVFFKFDAIDSESTNNKYPKYSEAYYSNMTITQPTSTGYTSGVSAGTTGRCVQYPLILAGPVTTASPKYFLAAANGDPIKNLVMGYQIPTGKDPTEYMNIKFEPVTIVAYTIAEPATSGKALEVIAVIAGKITVKHGSIETNWNFQTAQSS